jgi:hypothetical protein
MMGNDLEKKLLGETLKWIKRAEDEFSKVKTASDSRFIKNIEAYIKDSKYFLENKDLIRAFECVIWAWAWIEIGEEVGMILKENTSKNGD